VAEGGCVWGEGLGVGGRVWIEIRPGVGGCIHV
jgi:hypothetical protein